MSFIEVCIFFGLFCFRLPNINLFIGNQNQFFTLQAIARFLIITSFISLIIKRLLKKHEKTNNHIDYLEMFFILTLFVISTLTIIVAVNPTSFWERYKEILLGLMLYFLCKETIILPSKFNFIILLTTVCTVIYELFLHISQVINAGLMQLFSQIIAYKHWQMVALKLSENKYQVDYYNEIFIPLIFTLLISEKSKIRQLFLIILLSLIVTLSILSNIRTRLLCSIIGILIAVYINRKKINIKKYIILLFGFFIIQLIIVINIQLFLRSDFLFYERWTLDEYSRDFKPLQSRLSQIEDSMQVASNNILGVGLGNYYEYINSNPTKRFLYQPSNYADKWHSGGLEDVHNVFGQYLVETGPIGFLFFVLLLTIFFKNDLLLINVKRSFIPSYITAFWIFFVIIMLNPFVPGSLIYIFWVLRGII